MYMAQLAAKRLQGCHGLCTAPDQLVADRVSNRPLATMPVCYGQLRASPCAGWQVRNELEGLTFKAADGSLYPGSSLIPVGLQNTLSVEGNVLILLAFTVGTRVFAFALTEAAAKLRFL